MNKKPEFIDTAALDSQADENGVAIAVVDENSLELSVSNNNSICRHLNPGDGFSPDCSRYCGLAFEKAIEAGGMVGYECHAGLECRAVPVETNRKPLVVISGRTFVKAENYRKATQRAISGDWREYAPSRFFENILITGDERVLERTGLEAAKAVSATARLSPETPDYDPSLQPDVSPPEREREKVTRLVEKFNREVGLDPVRKQRPRPGPPASAREKAAKPTPVPRSMNETVEKRGADMGEWRSFFGSLLKTSYLTAANSILEFLAQHYGFTAMIWLERKERQFENTAAFGEMKNRRVRLGISPDDERLADAFRRALPLELGERSREGQPGHSRTMNLFPIGVEGEISAAIAVLHSIDDDAVRRQIARICNSLAPQLEILRLRNEVTRRESLSNAVRRFSESIKHIDSDDFWLTLTQNAAEMLRAERASLLLFDEKSETLEIKAMIGSRSVPAIGEEVGGRVAKIVFAKNEPVLISDVSRTGLPPSPERQYGSASFLSCPISIGNHTIGVMSFTDRACGKAFDRTSLDLFQSVAPQMAVAIDRATLKERAGEFEQLSVTDTLTGLLNRRYMEARLLEEIKRSTRHGFPMSFMMLDVDQFKSYNDQFGHPAGDEALKIVARVIRETLRGADVAARFGGEEFAILLPQTTGDEALAIADRIRINIERAEFPHRRVTASIGVATCSADLCVMADLISAADKALYRAKDQGRNRVLVFEGSYTG